VLTFFGGGLAALFRLPMLLVPCWFNGCVWPLLLLD
jgi:hypothetical protein